MFGTYLSEPDDGKTNGISIMKTFFISFLSVIAILCWSPSGFADRLHHWVDSKGVTHLSKNPPPDGGKLIEIMDYSVRADKPAKPDPAESVDESQKQKEKGAVEKRQETLEPPASQKNTATGCYIYANMEDVYVYAHEFSTPGGPQIKILYQGTIANGQKHFIQSSRGKIRFSYRRSFDDRTFGDNQAACVNGDVISIP